MIKVCNHCGAEFEGTSDFCSLRCLHIYASLQYQKRNYTKPATEKHKSYVRLDKRTLEDISKAADNSNMTYGQYMAAEQAKTIKIERKW